MSEALTFINLSYEKPENKQYVWLLQVSGDIVPAIFIETERQSVRFPGKTITSFIFSLLNGECTTQGAWAKMEIPINANTCDGGQ